ncbi:C4-dicarboxylate ABC transporter permease [Sulfitobacter sp. EhC04]|uniref:TRAP transporter large permease n=1 Tax=Sulfitobacter sp. EhC04 TaxID=1849168 RepID=UPI0007F421D8|nr:TRAP transporter large permease [Sulfitobacter sp. EhC04]OAN75670.1 C4-dicarboxylate ABC transporter permease [Sulfitobacter sp. EhC04]
MSDVWIGTSGLVGMFVLMALRVPVGMALLIAGFVGIWILRGERSATAVLTTEFYTSAASYSLIVIPLFVLMGNICSVTGFSRGLYDAAYAWVGRFRGGLASASVLGSAAFSAVSGSSVATAITIGRVAIPEMKRFNYSSGLAAGSVAAGGTLGYLIPPSTGFVVYGILTEESIGQLFMAGILPGLLLMMLFIVTIIIVTRVNPSAGPKGEVVGLTERLRALWGAVPLVSVIVISIGGIYAGAFTPVEAAGIGAGLVLIFAVAMRALSLRQFVEVCLETVRTTAMLYLIVIGASVLGIFMAYSGVPDSLAVGLGSLGLGAMGSLIVILIAYILLGTFMDALSMLVITLPITYPIILSFGFDPIWFGVILVIVIETGMITPPVGINVFVVKGIAQDIPLATIFKGVLPFWIAMIICLVLIIAFPQIALFIPQSMYR